ncbi:MAG TPA: AI-2E family transporter [Acidimicrobiales bacterium]|nr:AI-2E family transporter [Acidimicrobiales bacterium]
MPLIDRTPRDTAVRINPTVARLGTYAWKLIGLGIVGWALLNLLTALWVLVLTVAIAVLLGRALDPVAGVLRRRGLPRALVAAVTLLGFLLALAGIVSLLVPAIVDEFSDLGPTLEDAVDDVEDWLVNDSPFDVSRQDIDDFREEASDRITTSLESQSGTVVSGTVVAFEVVTGVVLALIATFFLLKDGDRFCRWVLGFVPEERRPLARRLGGRAWQTLGGYLRGSATLGVIEGIIIGTTVWLVGGSLAVPVAVITFFAAFLPFAGAVLAGAVAVLVTLVTSGFSAALIVLIVAVAVQQFDNDLLAPVVFGRSLSLHPLIVLGAIVAGSTLFGVFGAVLAVPVCAVVINVMAETRAAAAEDEEGADADGLTPAPEPGVQQQPPPPAAPAPPAER